MRALRKTKKCLNCQTPLDESYNYCPVCGQQNDDKNVSFKDLSRDLFENFFSFDSRLAHTFVPFFFKPGLLTTEFNKGRRFTYANPIRLYIIISVFYFFVLNVIVGDATRELDAAMDTPQADSVQQVVMTELDSADFAIEDNGTRVKITGVEDSSNLWPLNESQWEKFFELKDEENLSETAFYDSLHLENRHQFTQYTVKQMIRVYRKDKEHLMSKMVQNLSLMMFIMIPVFALLLKVLYIRRKILYVNHLIHTIHIHTFSFFMYGLAMAVLYWLVDSDNWAGIIGTSAFILVTSYAYLSFKRVYGQKWFKTLIKFWLTGFIYIYVLSVAVVVEMFLSFLVF